MLIVDLCGTVVRENTTHRFLLYRSLPLTTRLGARLLLSRPCAIFSNRVFAFDRRLRMIALLSGLSRSQLAVWSKEYARQALQRSAREQVLHEIDSAKQNGHPVVLASGSLDFIVESFALELGVDSWVATELEYEANGICTGKIKTDAVGRKLALLQRRGIDVSSIQRVITDNREDTDLLSVARDYWFIENNE